MLKNNTKRTAFGVTTFISTVYLCSPSSKQKTRILSLCCVNKYYHITNNNDPEKG